MREVKRRRALPVYIAAAVFAVYALVFPLYKLTHFLIAALVTAAAWLAADALIKPVTEYVPEPEPEPEPEPATPADAVVRSAKTARQEMDRLAASIPDTGVRTRIARLAELNDKIAQDGKADPADVPLIQKFQNYFLPSTMQLLNAYDRLAAQGVEGENISGTKQRIADMLDSLIQAYEKQLDALYKNDALDIDADISVMENLLKRQGLQSTDELQELLKKARAGELDTRPQTTPDK